MIFSYIDKDIVEEHHVSVPEEGGGNLIPENLGKPRHFSVVVQSQLGMLGIYKLEIEVISGLGKYDKTGVGSDRAVRESLDTTFRYFTANSKSISNTISTKSKDYLMHVSDLQGVGLTKDLAFAYLIGLA